MDITGQNLGVQASAVSIVYSGGSTGFPRRTYTPSPGSCTIVDAGARLQCPTVPGVGANYTFVVVVDGTASAPSSNVLSYAAPVVGLVYGPGASGAPTGGGVPIFVSGTGFGPLGGSTSVVVWAVPTADESLRFLASGCVVTEAHVTVRCTLGEVLGAALTWRASVEGQNSSLPVSTVAPLTVTQATFGDGVRFANTAGGTPLVVVGTSFGSHTRHTEVSVVTTGGTVGTTGCMVQSADVALRCVMAPGVGAISSVVVTLLGQSAQLDVSDLAYAAPTVASVSPSAWSTDVTSFAVTVLGSGFGGPQASSNVVFMAAAVGGPAGCGGLDAFAVNSSTSSVVSDTELSFVILAPAPHIAPAWALTASVAGQVSAVAITVTTLPPTAPAVGLAVPDNTTHRVLLLVGTNYGPGVSTCGNDVSVTVNGRPCLTVRMPASCLFRLVPYVRAVDGPYVASAVCLPACRSVCPTVGLFA